MSAWCRERCVSWRSTPECIALCLGTCGQVEDLRFVMICSLLSSLSLYIYRQEVLLLMMMMTMMMMMMMVVILVMIVMIVMLVMIVMMMMMMMR